jgi:predicted PolB exonuclease-like 3'-5' exonuclease
MVELGLEIYQVIELLETGAEISRRKKGIIEKWCHRGQSIYIVADEDYWLIRHVGKIRATKDKLKIMRGEHHA